MESINRRQFAGMVVGSTVASLVGTSDASGTTQTPHNAKLLEKFSVSDVSTIFDVDEQQVESLLERRNHNFHEHIVLEKYGDCSTFIRLEVYLLGLLFQVVNDKAYGADRAPNYNISDQIMDEVLWKFYECEWRGDKEGDNELALTEQFDTDFYSVQLHIYIDKLMANVDEKIRLKLGR